MMVQRETDRKRKVCRFEISLHIWIRQKLVAILLTRNPAAWWHQF